MFQVGQRTSKAQFVSYILAAALLANILAARPVESSLQHGATLIRLGTAQRVAVLGATAATNSGATTVFGNLDVSPGTTVTGFPSGIVSRGKIHLNDAVALQAQRDATTAYTEAKGQHCTTDLTGQDLGGRTLTPGVYCFASSARLTGPLTLDPQRAVAPVWIFQIGSTLTTASKSSVRMISGPSGCPQIDWQVGSSATLGPGTKFEGNILALTSITLMTSASVRGRALAQTGAVTMDANNLSVDGC